MAKVSLLRVHAGGVEFRHANGEMAPNVMKPLRSPVKSQPICAPTPLLVARIAWPSSGVLGTILRAELLCPVWIALRSFKRRLRALVHRLVAIVNDQDRDALPEVATGEIAEAARRWIGPFRDSFPDFRMDVVDVVAEHDTVAGHFTCSGTQRGEWMGNPPAGRRFEGIDEV
jgi:SnoaL-like polyketide cyclase